jgi:hypothetical protein
MMDGTFATTFVRHPAGLRDNPALVLNADYRPLSYFPLSLWPWQEAIKAAFLDRVTIVAEYDTLVHSPSIAMKLPSEGVDAAKQQPEDCDLNDVGHFFSPEPAALPR